MRVKEASEVMGNTHWTPLVTDQLALAAHHYWHRRTFGLWSCYVHDDDVPKCACGHIMLDGWICCRRCGSIRPDESAESVMEQGAATSGKLLALKPLESYGHMYWSSDCYTTSAGGCTAAEMRILFQHRLMFVWVNFRVKRLSPAQFQVKILEEDRQERFVSRHDCDGELRDRIQCQLQKGLVKTEQEIGCVTVAEIQRGPASWTVQVESGHFDSHGSRRRTWDAKKRPGNEQAAGPLSPCESWQRYQNQSAAWLYDLQPDVFWAALREQNASAVQASEVRENQHAPQRGWRGLHDVPLEPLAWSPGRRIAAAHEKSCNAAGREMPTPCPS